jgi:protein-tyrosine kinase
MSDRGYKLPPVAPSLQTFAPRWNQPAAKVSSHSLTPGRPFAHIDLAGLQEAGIPTHMGGRSRTLDEYRLIKRAILQNAASVHDKRRNLVMVTSALPGEGKTFTSISLAMSVAAETNIHVLLVDLDIAKRDVCRKLGIQSETGIIDLLDDSGHMLQQVVVPTDVPRLTILPAGADRPLAHELMASPNMRRLIEDLSTWYSTGLVIFDAAPVLSTPDAGMLASNAGQVILVVEANRTGRAAIEEAISLLKGGTQISFVLNKVDGSELVHQYGSYYGEPYNAGGPGQKPSIPERITNYVSKQLRRRQRST